MRIEWDRYRVTLGAVGRSRWTRGLTVEPTWSKKVWVDDNDLWFIWAGEARIRLRNGWVELRPGACVWLRPGWNYDVRQNPDRPLGLNFLHFDLVDEGGRRRPWTRPLPPEFITPHDPQLVETATRRIVELCFGFDTHGYSRPPYNKAAATIGTTLLTAVLMELDASTEDRRTEGQGKAAPHHDRLIRQVAVRLTENPQETIPVAKLAREHGYSPDHFARIFKGVTGQTPELYAVQARIRRAQRLLQETTMPVGKIAAAVGYRDIYFFSRQFKKFTKQTPRQYRQASATA